MSLLPFLAIGFAAGSLSLLLRRWTGPSAAIGVAGLLAAVVAAATIRAGDPVLIGEVALEGTPYSRLFLLLGCGTTLVVLVISAATTWSRTLPGATLVGLAAAGLAMGVTDGSTAITAATGGALVAILVAVPDSGSERGLLVAARELRAAVLAGVLALLAIAVASAAGVAAAGVAVGGRVDTTVLGLAFLAIAVATAVRLGIIPFHLRAARLADAAPAVALPLVMTWSPAAFAIVALAWVDGAVVPASAPLPIERVIVVLLAATSILFGTAAALLHDDLEHVVAYSIVADAGVALLGLAALDPAASAPTRTWILVWVAGKTALAAWAAAVRGTFGTGRLSELSGWARRAPFLALAVVGVTVAGVGWPGMAVFATRRDLAEIAVGGPIGALLFAGGLASVAVFVRLLIAGVRRPGPTVRATPTPWAAWRGSRRVRLRPAERARAMLVANRALIATAAAVALAGLAVAVSGGGLGVREAAAAPAAFEQPEP